MANALYDKAREKFLRGQINWDTDSIKVCLIDRDLYPASGTLAAALAAHEFLSDVTNPAAIVSAGVALVNKTSVSGAADSDDTTFSTVSGAQSEALLIYKDVGPDDPALSPLIAVIDSATGLPITPNGGDIIIVWDNGTNKIFKL